MLEIQEILLLGEQSHMQVIQANIFFPYTTPISSIPYSILGYQSPSTETYFFYDGHDGHDFAVIGDALASAAGTVVFAGDDGSTLGRVVEIYHPEGYLTRYAHLAEIYVNKGDPVNMPGLPIGKMGRVASCKRSPSR